MTAMFSEMAADTDESKGNQCNLQGSAGIIAQRRKNVIGGISGSIGP